MDDNDPERRTQDEIGKDASRETDDRETRREEMELSLMDADASEAGEVVGDEME